MPILNGFEINVENKAFDYCEQMLNFLHFSSNIM